MSVPKSIQGEVPEAAVAVIGMAGRFPGAADIQEYWRNLCDGVESITFFSDEELRPHIEPGMLANPDYIKARGIIADADKFDAEFFGVSPREAEAMDPQHRVLLETAWAAIEDAGLDEKSLSRLVGVYAGMANNTYLPNFVQRRPDIRRALGEFNIMLANEKDFLATRISYKLNLRGPSVNVYTGCSTSLVAICEAFHSLLSFRCDVALAGGVAISAPQKIGYFPVEGGIQSKDGHCRPFARHASGTVFSDGAGMVVLKRLEDAIEDGDRIEAVIRGAALNNDGADKISFAAPSVEGQEVAISLALSQAGVDPDTFGYIEAHGTGTHLGDPIELEALTRSFRASTQRNGFCAIGSVKSNIGHLLAAAGVAGFIKVVLMLKNGRLPPSLHFDEPNSEIDFARTPFKVQATLQDWAREGWPRRAGISSFGIGGTNAHVVLEEAPDQIDSETSSRPVQIMVLSAKGPEALSNAASRLASRFESEDGVSLADAAYTLQCGRKHFQHRCAVVCTTREQALAGLRSESSRARVGNTVVTGRPSLVFLFPGQGAQYRRMGAALYETERSFRVAFDQCSELFSEWSEWSLVDRIFGQGSEQLDEADALIWQPALFAVSYSLAEVLECWGVKPDIVMGHSLGELVAATRAGVISLAHALHLLACRSKWLRTAPEGGMMSVLLGEQALQSHLTGQLSLAATNSESLSVVAGPGAELNRLQAVLESDGVSTRRLASSLPFHSPLLAPLVDPLVQLLQGFDLAEPGLRMISAATGDWLRASQARDPKFWANQITHPVRFESGLRRLDDGKPKVVVEVGPGEQLATFFRQMSRGRSNVAAFSLMGNLPATECDHFTRAIANLWLHTDAIDWQAFNSGRERVKVSLPSYPFARDRHWADSQPANEDGNSGKVTTPVADGGRMLPGDRSPGAQNPNSVSDLQARIQARMRRRQQEGDNTVQ